LFKVNKLENDFVRKAGYFAKSKKPGKSRLLQEPQISMNFCFLKTADWIDRINEIKNSNNLVDQVVYVYLEFQKAHKQQVKLKNKGASRNNLNLQKLEFKKRLYAHLMSLGMDQGEVKSLILFIDWMITLPRELEERYFFYKKELTEQQEGVMAWMSTVERVSLRRGKELGKELGKLELAQEHVIKLIDRKFGLIQDEIQMILDCQDRNVLEQAHEQILFAETKEEILQLLECSDS
jgi:hypothetical protein